MKHENNGYCSKCHQLIAYFPGIYPPLFQWFLEFQNDHPEAHISCAGRGEAEQKRCYEEGTSRAQWGESAHNWNAALDFFVNKPGDIYNSEWFKNVLGPAIPDFLEWYGRPGSKFFELPHVQVKDWRKLRALGELDLVQARVELNHD